MSARDAGHEVLVRGAGAAGMALALTLSRQGRRVALLAGAAPEAPRAPDVRAYALNAASVELLASIKVWEALPIAARTAVHEMRIEGDGGHGALEFSAWSQAVGELAWIVDAAALEAGLHEAVRFAPHVQVVNEAAAAGAVKLTVLAEGKESASRSALGVRMHRRAYGHKAIAARLATDQHHAGVARQWFRSPDVLALLPIDQPSPGHGLAIVWSLPDARADDMLALPAAAFERVLADAAGGAAGALRLTSERVAWPLSIGRAERVFGPGWALVGDAAHVVHPLAGQGLNLGLADVSALAAVLAAAEPWREPGDERLLARYARARLAPTLAMGALTDALLHLFSHPSPVARELRNRGLGLVNRLPLLKRALVRQAIGR
jgi:2-polyprenyl-6-methoxyphenol hydroxylase-like FAD-dependent oxidoreductase